MKNRVGRKGEENYPNDDDKKIMIAAKCVERKFGGNNIRVRRKYDSNKKKT